MQRRRSRPSPAMFVALIALSLTLGGSAIAADTLSKKDVKKIAKKQAKKEIKKIKRAYVYSWFGAPRTARFDSGLINPNGTPRKAYSVVRKYARSHR